MDQSAQKRLRRKWLAIGLAGAAVLIGALFYQWRANSIVGPWTDAQGRRLPDGISDPKNGFPLSLHTLKGSSHCDWESVIFLHMSWPPGTVLRSQIGDDYETGRFRQYIRDPNGALGEAYLTAGFDSNARLPSDARRTGFRRGPWELWISPTEDDRAVYVVKDGEAERWPRAVEERVIACL